MGLDITAYSNMNRVDIDDDAGDEGWPRHVRAYPNPSWPDRAGSITAGWYERTEATEVMAFRAGGYSAYNAWRDRLSWLGLGMGAVRVWNGEAGDGPFVALIDFADNEGIIGPETSKRLADQFAEHRSRVAEKADADFMRLYDQLAAAFTLAANGGFVDFH